MMLRPTDLGGKGRCAPIVMAGALLAGAAHGQVGIDAAVIDELSLGLYSVQRIDVDIDVDSFVRADLVLDGKPATMSLFRHSMRSDDLRVRAIDGEGEETLVDPGPIRTYRGMLSGFRGSKVAASVHEGQIEAWIQLGHEVWAIQPLSDAAPGADPDAHVVYRLSEIIPGDWTCGVLDDPMHAHHGAAGTSPTGGGPLIAEVAFDADTEYYNANGNSVPATVADIESVMNAVELIYLDEVNLGYDIGDIIVRTGADPYTSSDPNTLLVQFQNEWTSNQAGVVRDVAHLFTGRDLNGNVIGIAYLDAVCDFDIHYGVSQSMLTRTSSPSISVGMGPSPTRVV